MALILNKYAKVNNPCTPDYDPTRLRDYLLYLKCTYIYRRAKTQQLLLSGFKWLEPNEIDAVNVQTLRDDDTGYIFEVELDYPHHLHVQHSNYPLAPEKLCITDDVLSTYLYRIKLLKGFIASRGKVES